jgi:hypothetical protein
VLIPPISLPLDLRADEIHAPISFVAGHIFPVIANAHGGYEPRSASAQVVFLVSPMIMPGSAGFLELLPPLAWIICWLFLAVVDLAPPHEQANPRARGLELRGISVYHCLDVGFGHPALSRW